VGYEAAVSPRIGGGIHWVLCVTKLFILEMTVGAIRRWRARRK